jgi:hypothetical protein
MVEYLWDGFIWTLKLLILVVVSATILLYFLGGWWEQLKKPDAKWAERIKGRSEKEGFAKHAEEVMKVMGPRLEAKQREILARHRNNSKKDVKRQGLAKTLRELQKNGK